MGEGDVTNPEMTPEVNLTDQKKETIKNDIINENNEIELQTGTGNYHYYR